MTQVRLRPKGQVTIPASILESAQIKGDTTFEVNLINGVITLTPNPSKADRGDIMAFAGLFKNAWGRSPEEIEKAVEGLRDESSR